MSLPISWLWTSLVIRFGQRDVEKCNTKGDLKSMCVDQLMLLRLCHLHENVLGLISRRTRGARSRLTPAKAWWDQPITRRDSQTWASGLRSAKLPYFLSSDPRYVTIIVSDCGFCSCLSCSIIAVVDKWKVKPLGCYKDRITLGVNVFSSAGYP